MPTFIGLLRGINVGGHNKLPMADLRSICEGIRLKDVRTYIQSGNIVFSSEKTPSRIALELTAEIDHRFGFAPKILILPADEIRKAAESYPFPTDDHRLSHIMFLDARPADDEVAKVNLLKHDPDKLTVGDKAVYFYTPNGISGSKLDLNKIERTLGVNVTTRNWRTVQKLIEMAL
ncbi:MAG: DUF1697 domain-containing protein [Acidobacteriota bacterium]|nr:DUF1697 domain-containing protein [Acidobacteriota bacterium]